MKISKDIMIIRELRFDDGKECLEIMDGEDIKVITGDKTHNKIYEGQFEFVDNENIVVDRTLIPIKHIEEILVIS